MNETGENVQGFSTLSRETLFQEFLIESRSDDHIAFTCNIQNLCRGLASGKQASVVSMRLLKQDGRSYLSFKMRAIDIEVTQNIPIQLISIRSMEQYAEPLVPSPTVQIELPATNRSLRTVVDRLKSMHKYLTIDASMDGRMALRTETETTFIQTHFRNVVPRFDLSAAEEPHEMNGNRIASVKLDGKQFAKALSIAQSNSTTDAPSNPIVCCITQGHTVVLHNVLWDNIGTVTYFIPVMSVEVE